MVRIEHMADQNQNQPNQQVAVPLQNDFVRTARILAQRTRRNNVTRRRAVTKDEREAARLGGRSAVS